MKIPNEPRKTFIIISYIALIISFIVIVFSFFYYFQTGILDIPLLSILGMLLISSLIAVFFKKVTFIDVDKKKMFVNFTNFSAFRQ